MLSHQATLLYLLGASVLPAALAANDFTTACRGSCSYESGDGVTTAWNSIVLDGAPEAISDISEAAGWHILDCDATSTEAQVVRIVCTKPENGCDDLFLGGIEDTIVRLPENCAGAPFARIITANDSEDQSLPATVMAELSKRNTQPKVLSLAFDYDFAKIPASRGEVTFTTVATTNPFQRPLTQVSQLHAALKRSTGLPSFLRKRDLFEEFVSNNKITADGPRVSITAVNRTTTTSGLVEAEWDQSGSHTFDLLDVHKNFPIFDGSIDCPASAGSPFGFSANIHLDTDVDVSVTLTVGFIISGKIFPPSITRAAFTTALEGGAQAVFNVRAEAIGTFDTGLLTLYGVALPGLDIPGIITVGPSFAIKAQAQASLDAITEAKITAAYKLPKLQFVFPKDQGSSNADADDAAPAQPLTLSIGGAASLTGKVEAHVVPRVEFGISLLLGAAKATIYLGVDGYGVLDMHLAGSIAASTSIPIPIGVTAAKAPANTNIDTAAATAPVIAADISKSLPGNNLYKPLPVAGAGSKRDGFSYTYEGCVGLDAGVSVNGGAEGNLFNLWSGNVNWDIYSEKWDIFEKCFGGSSSRRRSEPKLHAARFNLRSNQLACPSVLNKVVLI